MKVKILLVCFFLNLSFFQKLNGQEDLKNLISAFDKFNYNKVDSLLTRVDKTALNTTQFSVFSIIKYFRKTDLNKKELEEYFNSISFFQLNGSVDFLPTFINNYASKLIPFVSAEAKTYDKNFYTYIKQEHPQLSGLLETAIDVEKKNNNKSHYTSNYNLYNSYRLHSLVQAEREKKITSRQSQINHYKENKESLSYITKTSIYNAYESLFANVLGDKAAFSKIINPKKLLEEFIFLKKELDGYTYNSDSSFEAIIQFAIDIMIKKNETEGLLALEKALDENYYYFQNQLINFYLAPSLSKFNVLLENIVDFGKKLTYWESSSLERAYYNEALSGFYKKINSYSTQDKDVLFRIFSNIYYNQDIMGFSKITYSMLLNHVYNFNKYYQGELVLADKYVHHMLFDDSQESLHDILKENYENNFEEFDYNSYITLFDLRLTFGTVNQDTFTKEIMFDIDAFYKKEEYKNFLFLVDAIFQNLSSLVEVLKKEDKELASEELNILKKNIASKYLKNDNSLDELKLKTKLATNNEELDRLITLVKEQTSFSNIEKTESSRLIKEIYIEKLNKNWTLENAKNLISLFINSPQTEQADYDHLMWLIDATMSFNLDYAVPFVSIKILEHSKAMGNTSNNQRQYSYLYSVGQFYKRVGRNEEALLYFLETRANNYHWQTTPATLQFDLKKEFLVLGHIIDLCIETNRSQDTKYYIELYESHVSYSKEFIKNNPQVFLDVFAYEKDLINYKTRFLWKKKEYEKAANLITDFINKNNLEPKSLFLFKQTLISSKLSAKEPNKPVLKEELKQLYEEFKEEKDSYYYTFINDEIESFEYNLRELKKEVNLSVDVINQLSYDNQLPRIKELYGRLKLIEYYVSEHENKKDIDHIHTSIAELLLNLDNIDTYNTRLLQLKEEDQQTYFALRDKRYSKSNNILSNNEEFDLFQQKIKSEFKKHNQLTVLELMSSLKENEAYLRFSRVLDPIDSLSGPTKYLVYYFSKEKFKAVYLQPVDLTRVYNYYKNQITQENQETQSFSYFFRPVYDLIEKDINKLYVKNDGFFNNVNLETLKNPTTNKYLIDEFDISYIEKTNSIFNKTTFEFKTAFLFGNPQFGEGELVSALRTGLNQLPNTETEVKEISKILNSNQIKTVETNLDSSTEESIYKHSFSDIVHIATHGFFSESEPEIGFNFGLFATNAKDAMKNRKNNYENDGIIYGSEISFKNFTKTKVVVLSACETGTGEANYLGTLNLTNSFIRAGAKNVISTLWQVDDKATKEFMVLFYSKLVQNNDVSNSLRETKLEFKNKYFSPKYWGGFVLTKNIVY